jgi:soluble lytic murein transglycosylase-like protein
MIGNLFITFAISLAMPDPNLLNALCYVETRNKDIFTKNDVGSPSYGACQIKLATANWMHLVHEMDGPYLNHADLMHKEINIYYAALYLKHQIQHHPGDLRCAISAFNAGRCIKSNQKTYVDKVLKRLTWLNKENPVIFNNYAPRTVPDYSASIGPIRASFINSYMVK